VIEVVVLVAIASNKTCNSSNSSNNMATPPEEQQSQPSTSRQGQSNGAGAPAAGQPGPRKAMKEMSKGQLGRLSGPIALNMSSY
jgi:hypothetical protein